MGDAFVTTVKFFGGIAVMCVLIFGGQLLHGVLFDVEDPSKNKLARIGCFSTFLFGMVWLFFTIANC